MSTTIWRFILFGGLAAERPGEKITRFRTRKTASLLAYLALYADRCHPRDELVELFWPEDEPEAARASLRTALNSLRKQLEPLGFAPGTVLVADRNGVQIPSRTATSDVLEFTHTLRKAAESTRGEGPELLDRAIGYYRGELLPGFYDDWIQLERSRLASMYMGALRELISESAKSGRYDAAIEYSLAAVAADPVAEDAHLSLIRLYRAVGRPADALRQYAELERILRDSLDVRPSDEAQALVASMRGSTAKDLPRQAVRAPAGERNEARRRITFDRHREPVPAPPSLPVPMTPLYGREDELARIEEALIRDLAGIAVRAIGYRSRLLTLIGPGGIGKTRLAIESARRVGRAFGERIWFVPLAGLTEAQALPDSIVDALGLTREAGVDWVRQVQSVLDGRSGLLVLDNFEHIVEEGAQLVERLLAAVPELVCLVTSRVRLDLPVERAFPVSPLVTPPGEPDSIAGLAHVPSVSLFVDRARAARPDFRITEANARAVAELCRRLEGLPLALELSASWSQALTPSQMLDRTRERLGPVTTRRKGGEDRHRSVQAAVEWSYRLLSPDLQRVFRRLSVFRGGWSLDAAAAVCFEGDAGELDALSALTTLVGSSLVTTQEVQTRRGPEMRFGMLETLREFGNSMMDQDERREIHARHADLYCASARAEVMESYDSILDRLGRDLDNFRAALHWLAESPGRGEDALRLAVGMSPLWHWWDHMAEAIEWMERLLPHTQTATPLRADAINAIGNSYYGQKNGSASLHWQKLHLEERERMQDELGIAKAQCNIGASLNMLGRSREAVEALEKSVRGFEQLNPVYLPSVHLDLGIALFDTGEQARGEAMVREALRAYEAVGTHAGAGNCYSHLGDFARRRDSLDEARAMYESALAEYRAAGRPDDSETLAALAEMLELSGKPEEARALRWQPELDAR